ncbi:MAG TPA: hypothetical protein GX708_03520 [Gallicola sp.]|nr:hypothetical protein [Gallicola sp.]
MENTKNKFNALTPKVLYKNNPIYTEALDYAFSNDDIKNIAITGIYGAGKSTVWKTYIKNKNFENIITVSLGKYEDNTDFDLNDNNSKKIEKEDATNDYKEMQLELKKESADKDNRVERQLINQMLSQIKSNKIPLSKYRFKSNKTWWKICLQVIALFFVISSILIWMTRNTIIQFVKELDNNFKDIYILGICAILLFVPLFYFLYLFYRDNRLRISKINVKGAEANFNGYENIDETVLDRDIKEIVYLLNSSETEIVVFEDLDRYDNIEIYTKLRELNFLLNSYVATNGNRRIIRFVYMLKDGLFFSKNRTKFFDFILPIVPVVDSKTSENQLLILLKDMENSPDRNVLANISLYIDDMRLLKNIVNEYTVYSNIIPLGDIKLEKNKLFALITLKNIFPNEFDLLQGDRGYIRSVFDKLEKSRKIVIYNLESKLVEVEDKISFIKNRLEKDRFQMMALMISVDVKLNYEDTNTWDEFLMNWSKDKDRTVSVSYRSGSSSFNYEQFVERFIATTEERKNSIAKMPIVKDTALDSLYLEVESLKNQIKDVETLNFKDILFNLDSTKRDEVFSTDSKIKESYYFSLIRFLISDGLIDETYWYYKGNFDIEKSETLKRNDIIYMKGLLEGKNLDIFLDVETPREIINRLKEANYNRFNILNKKILKYCINENYLNKVFLITNTSIKNDKINDLIEVINSFDFDTVYKYVSFLLKKKIDFIIEILESCSNESMLAFKNVLISVCVNNEIASEQLQLFSSYIEQNENLISLIDEDKLETFIENISAANIKFEVVSEAEVDIERLKQIEKIQAYKLDIQNITFITRNLLERNVEYGNLLNEIYQSEVLTSSRKYIRDNFVDFISQYIDGNVNEDHYTNSEKLLVEILTSDISDEYKLQYASKNKTIVSDVQKLESISENKDIFAYLLNGDMVEFNKDNVNSYWNMIKTYNVDFINYIDRNINEKNAECILENNNSICNIFINDPDISDKLFGFVLSYADKQIEVIDAKLSGERVNKLIQNNLFAVTDDNIACLLANSYHKEIVMLANSGDQDFEDDVIIKLLGYDLSDKLIYMLVNSDISDENSIKLVDIIEDSILIENINSDKEAVIGNIISNNLSDVNIKYICQNFESFNFKAEFIYNLDNQNKLVELGNESLNEHIMLYILEDKNISIDTKLQLITIKINNKPSADELIKYISVVKEISDIAYVWNNKYPTIDSIYKEKISQALIDGKYVKERNDKDAKRIMQIK